MDEFQFVLTEVRWFGDEVAWLHPDPPDPFTRLVDAIRRRHPQLVPYNNPDLEFVPHVTIGQDSDLVELETAASEAADHLPIRATAQRVDLMMGSDEPGSWRVTDSFPLAPTG